MIATMKLDYKNGFRLPTPKKKKEYKEHSQFVYALIYYRKEILLATIILFMMLSGLFVASCKTWADFTGNGDIPQLLGVLLNNGGWIDQILGANNMAEYAGLLSITASGNTITGIGGIASLGGLSGVLTSVNNLFQVLGLGLALIFWGYGFSEMMMESNGQLILEQVIKKLVFLSVSVYVIQNSLTLCCEIINAGTQLTNAALGAISAAPTVSISTLKESIFNECWTEVKIPGFIDLSGFFSNFGAIGWLLQLIVPYFVTKICDIIIRVLCWSRAIEICIFAAISPIMFIDLGTTRDLTHSSTARAIKNLLSLAMQGALILISLTVCSAIMNGILTNAGGLSGGLGVTTFWQLSLVAILQVGTISKTQSVAKQALGV